MFQTPFILVDFEGFPKLVSLWKGIVRVDLSLAPKVDSGLDYTGYRIITIKDSKYSYADNSQLDNMHGEIDFPNEIVMFIIGNEILERMWCTVVKGYKEKPRKKLLQRSHSTYKSLSCKGFILEPASAYDTKDVEACLGLFQFDNEFGNEITFDRLGMHIFTSGSQTSNMTFIRDQRKSVTAAFISSRDKPIVAYIYSRDKTLRFFSDDSGTALSEVKINKQNAQHFNPTAKKDALEILKTRLASGEISTEEYHKLKRIIQKDEDYTSNWI
jgi:Short C-terminal domain